MDIENKIFQRRRFVPELMEAAGFRQVTEGDKTYYEYERDFMDGDFRAILRVDPAGKTTAASGRKADASGKKATASGKQSTANWSVSGRVIDLMNDEEYEQLRIERFNGAFVGQVRAAYEELLEGLAEKCCREVAFASEQANRITDQILARYEVTPDFPWSDSQYQTAGTFRHADTGKWFGLIMNINMQKLPSREDGDEACEAVRKEDRMSDVINLKVNPEVESETRTLPGGYPAYHMNHRLWISVVLDDTLNDDQVMWLVDASFRATGK